MAGKILPLSSPASRTSTAWRGIVVASSRIVPLTSIVPSRLMTVYSLPSNLVTASLNSSGAQAEPLASWPTCCQVPCRRARSLSVLFDFMARRAADDFAVGSLHKSRARGTLPFDAYVFARFTAKMAKQLHYGKCNILSHDRCDRIARYNITRQVEAV